MKVLFRTDASLEIGTGHVMRCLTLADALRQRGCESLFVCREHPGHLGDLIHQHGYAVHMLPVEAAFQPLPLNPSDQPPHLAWLGADWEADAGQTAALAQANAIGLLVIDHYALDHRWESKLRQFCDRILVIDDLADRDHDCDYLLDQNLVANLRGRYANRVPEDCGMMLGPAYALLQAQYSELHDRIPLRVGPVRRLLIYFGGADTDNLTGIAISACLALSCPADVVANPKSPHIETIRKQVQGHAVVALHETLPSLSGLMANADLAIGAGGTTSWERCSLGLPSLVITLAENQRPIAAELNRQGFIRWLGHKDEVTEADLIMALKPLLENGLDPAWSEQCSRLVDGMGARRVSDVLSLGPTSSFRVRPATRNDESGILESIQAMPVYQSIAADGDTTQAVAWFRQTLREMANSRIYMVETQEGVLLGWALFHLVGECWEIAQRFSMTMIKSGLSARAQQQLFREMRSAIGGSLRFISGWRTEAPAWLKPAVSNKTSGQKSLSIAICSDKDSWINDYVPELILSGLFAGHDVSWVHSAEDAPGGDLCFYLSYGRIVGPDVRSRYAHNLVVHESDLPKGRGWAPMSWQILEGASVIPVTLLEAVEDVDAGAIYLQDQITLDGCELNPEWRAMQASSTLKLCRSFVENYPAVLSEARAQVGEHNTYSRRRAEDSRLDPDKSIRDQFKLFRIVNNEDYPAFFDLNGQRFVLRIEKLGAV